MLIYSAKIPVVAELNKEIFVKLVIEWNQHSPYDKMNSVVWDMTTYNQEWHEGDKNLSIIDLSKQKIAAARFWKKDKNEIVWTNDIILNYEEHILVIQLDRATTEFATNFTPNFKPPYFVKLLIQKGCAREDAGLPISDTAIPIHIDNIDVIQNIILKKSRLMLPVVYVTKKWGKYAVNPDKLAINLQGIAHVLKESDTSLSNVLKKNCSGQYAHNGEIEIYFPNISLKNKKYHADGGEERLRHRIVQKIFQYCNQQKVDDLFTWESIQIERLSESHQKVLSENLELCDLYAEIDNKENEYKKQIEKLNRQILSLKSENQGLHEKLDGNDEIPLLFFGDEEDLFEGEIKELILDCLDEYRKQHSNEKRRNDVINDILESNDWKNNTKKRQAILKQILKGYSSMSGTMRKDLEEFGFTITEDGKHYKLTYYQDNRYTATMAKTGSDHRGGSNLTSSIRKLVL